MESGEHLSGRSQGAQKCAIFRVHNAKYFEIRGWPKKTKVLAAPMAFVKPPSWREIIFRIDHNSDQNKRLLSVIKSCVVVIPFPEDIITASHVARIPNCGVLST